MSTFSLQPLLDLAHTRMDDAARRLGELIAMETEGQRKLEILQTYRDEYHQRFMQALSVGIDPDTWRNYSAFLARIDEAIAAQHNVIEQSHQRTLQGQQIWLAQRNKVKAIDTLSQRHKAADLRLENKREQRLLDEHSARQFSKKREE